MLALYVIPEAQRQGIGQALWDAAVAELAGRGHDALQVWVLASNAGARRFYERNGGIAVNRASVRVGEIAAEEIGYRVALR